MSEEIEKKFVNIWSQYSDELQKGGYKSLLLLKDNMENQLNSEQGKRADDMVFRIKILELVLSDYHLTGNVPKLKKDKRRKHFEKLQIIEYWETHKERLETEHTRPKYNDLNVHGIAKAIKTEGKFSSSLTMIKEHIGLK